MRALGLAAALFALGCGGRRQAARDAAADQGAADAEPDVEEPDVAPLESPPAGRCLGGTLGFKPTEFKSPAVHCHWAEDRQVVVTPLVLDVTGDSQPEVFFSSFEPVDTYAAFQGGRLHAVSGTDCRELWTVEAPGLGAGRTELAVGDLDRDGRFEIVGVRMDTGALVIYDARTGALRVEAEIAGLPRSGAVSLANVDGDGPAEIVVGSAVLRLEGDVIAPLWVVQGGPVATSAVADLDGDGRMEVVSGRTVHDGVTGAVKLDLGAVGFTAIAEFDPASPGPELIRTELETGQAVVRAGLTAPTPGAILFGPYTPPTGRPRWNGGSPAVADFDGDGTADFGVASARHYTVYARICAGPSPPVDRCYAPGILWRRSSRDESSAITTSTVFDFNCDGRAEVVYRDECWLRVYEGATGEVLFATSMTSGTYLEGAAVADTDGTGRAKIVIGTNDYGGPSEVACEREEYTGTPFTGRTRGLFILRDPEDRWQPTRRLWNQNGYHVTNIDDDGTIPLHEEPSWLTHNTYRANRPNR